MSTARLTNEQVTPESLLALVAGQAASCRRLLELGQRKQEILIAGDIMALARLLPEEQEALAGLIDLETKYAHECAEFARLHALESSSRYEHLMSVIGEPTRSQLAREMEQLSELAELLQTLVASNSQLIARARSFIEFSLYQAGKLAGQAVYDDRGTRKVEGSGPSLSTRLSGGSRCAPHSSVTSSPGGLCPQASVVSMSPGTTSPMRPRLHIRANAFT